jgi:hypothetical protein
VCGAHGGTARLDSAAQKRKGAEVVSAEDYKSFRKEGIDRQTDNSGLCLALPGRADDMCGVGENLQPPPPMGQHAVLRVLKRILMVRPPCNSCTAVTRTPMPKGHNDANAEGGRTLLASPQSAAEQSPARTAATSACLRSHSASSTQTEAERPPTRLDSRPTGPAFGPHSSAAPNHSATD